MSGRRSDGGSSGEPSALKQYGGHAVAIVVLAGAVAALVAALPAGAYVWMKALHVIAVIAWMGGLLYLPRLFVYHVAAEEGSVQSETFKVMERRLLRAIMTPSMIVSAVTGFWLAIAVHGMEGGWLHAKIALIVVLFAVHGHFAAAVRRFAGDANRRSSRYWRFMNEVPTLAMIAIVIFVILKPC